MAGLCRKTLQLSWFTNFLLIQNTDHPWLAIMNDCLSPWHMAPPTPLCSPVKPLQRSTNTGICLLQCSELLHWKYDVRRPRMLDRFGSGRRRRRLNCNRLLMYGRNRWTKHSTFVDYHQWLKWFCEAGRGAHKARLEQTPYPFQPH